MKVKNEYIQIKLGNKTYVKKNMLLRLYIDRLLQSQIDPYHFNTSITNCYIKFDEPIENVDYDTRIPIDEFDVILYDSTMDNILGENKFDKMSKKTSNSIQIVYKFDNKNFFEYDGEYMDPNQFEIFNNRKITAIGFGYGANVYAFLDTSNMNIVVNNNEKIEITRVDRFESDGICKGFDFPLHLVNDSAHYNLKYEEINNESISVETMAQIYSIGFGSTMGNMEEEYLFDDVSKTIFDNEVDIDIECDEKVGKYPSKNLQLGFMPTKDNSKYLIFKYRLYRHYSNNTIRFLDEYYTMSYPNDSFGNLKIVLKIERL